MSHPLDQVLPALQAAPFHALGDLWASIEDEVGDAGRQWLCKNDRYYLLTRACRRIDAIHPWLYARCREVEANPDGYLDLWARNHYKSTIITFSGIIQEILRNPEITISIFSHTKPIAKAFLKQIQSELERNQLLHHLFPDVLYTNPERDSPSWSLDNGVTIKRKTNPKEPTIYASGLVDGQPISKHFALMVYDDVVVPTSVATPEQINKTTDAWALSDNLGMLNSRKWHIGTRYSYADTYEVMIDRKAVIPRLHPATDDGTITGEPVFLSKEQWQKKITDQGEAIIACQMLQNPLSGQQRMFNIQDIREYEVRPELLNVYIMVDPARSKKQGSDRTAIVVLGVDLALNKYLLDGFNHKMDLRERWVRTAQMYHRWRRAGGVQHVKVGYEAFGAQADLDYFKEQMGKPNEGGHFTIEELMWPRDSEGSKVDRVQRLGPDLRAHKFFIPAATDAKQLTKAQRDAQNTGYGYRVAQQLVKKNEQGADYDLAHDLKMQLHYFPFGGKKDLADAASRIYDLEPQAPRFMEPSYIEPEFT